MAHSHKWISVARRLLLTVAIFATLAVTFVTVENWRGNRAWSTTKRDLSARGARLDTAVLDSPRIPEQRDFFQAPMLRELVLTERSDARRIQIQADAKLDALQRALRSWKLPDDSIPLRDALQRAGLITAPFSDDPAEDALTGLAPAAPLLDAIRNAAYERPDAWLPNAFATQSQLPDAEMWFRLGRLLVLRAQLENATGRRDAAFADTIAALRSARHSWAGTPTLLSVLVGHAIGGEAVNAIEAGLKRHAWTDAQLAALQTELTAIGPFSALHLALEVERAWMIHYMDATPKLEAKGFAWPRWWFHGWAQQNKVNVARMFEDVVLPVVDVRANRLWPDRLARLAQELTAVRQTRSPYRWINRVATEKLAGLIENVAHSHNKIVQATAACALERHRLAHGQYPDRLADVDAQLLPASLHDIVTGQPLTYTRLKYGYTLGASAGPQGRKGNEWLQDD